MKQNAKKFASAEQKSRLIQLVEADPDLNNGKISKSFPIIEANKRWLAISHELNSLPGVKKTWKEWRKTWQDRKSNVKKRRRTLLSWQENLGDGSTPSECPTRADCLITVDQGALVVQGLKIGNAKKFASQEQKYRLLRLVEADPQLKSGKFTKSFTKFEARKRWIAISHKLNSIPGAKKTWEEWRKTWQDKKANAKKHTRHRQTNSQSRPPPEPPVVESFHDNNDQLSFGENDDSQESKPTLFDFSQPGPSAENIPTLDSSNHKSSDVRWSADADRQLQQEQNSFEAITERLMREKLEIKKKFYEDYIRLMSSQTQALVDIAAALNGAAAMTDVLQ
ncbi:uncharacterized protein LOC121739088 [Aricia agestis]|uniref:uncharacterized protein LOC121739088 n=1 Tax=Aricia agestis TaxID=91739 RepID=UPI001C2028AD|nr:uncharacterized protein LOC121739088 [Aricia agestis]